jgi:hypothetical protein
VTELLSTVPVWCSVKQRSRLKYQSSVTVTAAPPPPWGGHQDQLGFHDGRTKEGEAEEELRLLPVARSS